MCEQFLSHVIQNAQGVKNVNHVAVAFLCLNKQGISDHLFAKLGCFHSTKCGLKIN